MAVSSSSERLQASGFFVLRTPLMPFDELVAWSVGLQAPDALADSDQLEAALAADRAVLTERLRAMWARPEAREAVFLASPELDAALERSIAPTQGDGGAREFRSFVAYFTRMAPASAPIGLVVLPRPPGRELLTIVWASNLVGIGFNLA